MSAKRQGITLDTIEVAQQGCQKSLTCVTEEAQGKVSVLLFRMTLDSELSGDLTQETMLTLIRSLPRLQLQSIGSFWTWVYRTAVGKLQHHRRVQGNKRLERKIHVDHDAMKQTISTGPGPLSSLMKKESIDIVLAAMAGLKTEYRGVLCLRCIDGLSYPQIATIMGGSSLRVRMLFRRAKVSLRQKLAGQGKDRSFFLPAIAVFAALSAQPGKGFIPTLKAGTDTLVLGASQKAAVTMAIKVMISIGSALIVATGITTVMVTRQPNSPPIGTQSPLSNPIYDDSIRNIYDDQASPFISIESILRTDNPDSGPWRYFTWPQGNFAPAVSISSVEDRPSGTYLVLPKDYVIEYTLPEFFRDRPGYDLAIQLWVWGRRPDIVLTDGAGQRCSLSPVAYRGQSPWSALAFDLAQTQLSFVPKTLCIEGIDNEGPYQGCGLGLIAVRTAKR